MTQQTTDNREDVMHRISSMDCDHQIKGTQLEHNTTEERTLALGLATPPTKSRYLTRRMGWYFTERYPPCGIKSDDESKEGLDGYKLHTLFGA